MRAPSSSYGRTQRRSRVPDSPTAALLRVLEAHRVQYVVIGAQAAIVHGAPLATLDVDITPSRDEANLDRLAAALRELDARLRSPADPGGVAFPIDGAMLSNAESWTLETELGDLDLVFVPAGTRGYEDLKQDARQFSLADNLAVWIASLADVIRCKQAAARPKDLQALPILRQTLEEIRRQERGR